MPKLPSKEIKVALNMWLTEKQDLMLRALEGDYGFDRTHTVRQLIISAFEKMIENRDAIRGILTQAVRPVGPKGSRSWKGASGKPELHDGQPGEDRKVDESKETKSHLRHQNEK